MVPTPMSTPAAQQCYRAAEQYSLRALRSGLYPVMTRGHRSPTAMVWLEKGDVWKFGKTINPGTRYTQSFLSNTGQGLRYSQEFRGTATQALNMERESILNYERIHGVLPPGNKVRR